VEKRERDDYPEFCPRCVYRKISDNPDWFDINAQRCFHCFRRYYAPSARCLTDPSGFQLDYSVKESGENHVN
jgi:hypothetical protein